MQFSHLKKLRKYDAAQGMVEFLIVLPVMLLLLMGILQFAFIYQAKITLNYAAFEAARAGSLNNASMDAMEAAFASGMAPLYTSSYLTMADDESCSSSFTLGNLGDNKIMQDSTTIRPTLDDNIDSFVSGNALCGKATVATQIEDGYVNIELVNPGADAFSNFGVDMDFDGTTETAIPNDNLMYRDATARGGQSIQDANLLKIHIGYCFELIVPFANNIIWGFHRYATGRSLEDRRTGKESGVVNGYFGTPSTDFAQSCISNPTDANRKSIVLYSQGIMRMQSAAIQE